MKLRLIGIAVAISLLPAAAHAQLAIDMSKWTCAQYLAMAPATAQDFSAWMSGWFSYQTRKTMVDIAAHQKNIESVRAWCQFRPRAHIMSALEAAINPQ